MSSSLNQRRASYEFKKYCELLEPQGSYDSACAFDRPFSYVALRAPNLRDQLTTHAELISMQLGVCGAYVFLTDSKSQQHLLAGGQVRKAGDPFNHNDCSALGTLDHDTSKWLWLFQQTFTAPNAEPCVLNSAALREDAHIFGTSSVCNRLNLAFFAGVALFSRTGHRIGILFVVSKFERAELSGLESARLIGAAQKCSCLLDTTREQLRQKIWVDVNGRLDSFVNSSAIRADILEQPPTTKGKFPPGPQDNVNLSMIDENQSETPLFGLGSSEVQGKESERLVKAEIERDQRIAHEDTASKVGRPRSNRGDDDSGSETTYRKVFRRASQCLREAYNCDGVLFVDGLIGLRGLHQPSPETEQDLEHEIRGSSTNNSPRSSSLGCPSEQRGDGGASKQHTRVFASPDYQRSIHIERPTEILGLAAFPSVKVDTTHLTRTTLGLDELDEGFLQRILDRHPDGAVWHFGFSDALVKFDTLQEQDLEEETYRLRNAFPGLRQLVFQPLTDPTSQKRLAGCFLWRVSELPAFSDVVDLPCIRGFLHVVESEISRIDASAAAKQQESFVSSVSHELRTPLHGILGTVQLLKDSQLDEMQQSLVNTIYFCGDTLHNTLTSVLSYAKINQFQRRQHKYRQRRPPDSQWALPDKQGRSSGPDREFNGLYICTNVAMLCEEILGVLEAGHSFQQPVGSKEVVVVMNVQYDDVWSFQTEPGALRRITINLIGNALKYTAEGSVIVTLKTSKLVTDPCAVSKDEGENRTLVLTVKDTGRGISKEFIENQLFVPFTQESTGTANGVGLGMSIVKSLVTLLSGEIQVQSEVGVGTEIKVTLPMQGCKSNQGDDAELRPHEVEFVQNIEKVCRERLQVCIFGFPEAVVSSLKLYLQDWFHCTILENVNDAEPDVVLVDEGNEGIHDEVHSTARLYGHRAVLLNIVMTANRMGTPMEAIQGYSNWERIPRPLGPGNMGQTLLRCIEKLRKLKVQGGEQVDMKEQEEVVGRGSNQEGTQEKAQRGSCETSSPNTGPRYGSQRGASQRNDGTPKSSDLQVLLVDDNALNLRLLETFLTKAGYHNTEKAENGKEAVEAVRKKSNGFNIIFMDMSMPVMDGFEATRHIRHIEDERDVTSEDARAVVIALTGLGSRRDEQKAFHAGVDMFVTKPVQFNDLAKVLEQCETGTFRRSIATSSSQV